MLNKKQSPKRNLLKYTLIIPALVAFVMLFQIKVIAQEKTFKTTISTADKDLVFAIDKNTTDFKLKQEIQKLKENHGINLKVSKVKRNDNFEITAIKIQYEDTNGNKGSSQVASDEPIAPISIIKKTDLNGKSSISLLSGKPAINTNKKKITVVANEKDNDTFSFSFSNDEDDENEPSVQEVPVTPNPSNIPNPPSPPAIPKAKVEKKVKVITEKNGDKPTVYINGEKIDLDLDELDFSFDTSNLFNFDALDEDISITGNGKKGVIVITTKDGKTEINMGKEMERFREEMEKAKSEVMNAFKERKLSTAEMEKAKSEMMKAFKEREKATPEIEKAKKEMEKAKAAMEKARLELEKARQEALKQQKI